MEDDSDEDDLDKQSLSKRFKIMTPIPNLIPQNTFVPKDLLKPEEPQRSLHDFTNQLFGTTSSKFSPTPPREPTPPRDLAKGKEVAIVHTLASKKTRKSNDMLLQSLRAKFQWVMVQAKKLGFPLPPALAIAEEKKRKRTQFLKEAFVTEDIKVDGMDRNLIPPPEVVPIEGLVIREHESGIFYMNRNADIVFQRE
ncbi:hypothetical protein Tco_1550705 [Tanacetum coccineum]